MDSVLDSKALSNPFQKEDQRHGHTLEHNHFLLLLPLTENATTKGDIVHNTKRNVAMRWSMKILRFQSFLDLFLNSKGENRGLK